MKAWKILLTTCAIAGLVSQASAYTIDDKYIGSDPTHNYAHKDVIGEDKYYNVAGMNVATSGSTMSVDIVNSFVAQTSSSTIWNDQTHIGDLFIGTGGWNPYGSSSNNYSADNALKSGTIWDYVVVLTPRIPTVNGDTAVKGQAKVYEIERNATGVVTNGNFVMSNIGTLPESRWIYRSGQYVQFNPYANAQALYTGTWEITRDYTKIDGNQYGNLAIDFSYAGIDAASNDWAFHWGMTCGNDIIEGETYVPPVPEPSTFILLGAGLLGAVLYRRKKQ